MLNYVLANKKYPNEENLKFIEEEMFLDLKNTENINLKIKKIAENNEVFLLERKKIFCDLVKKRCPSVTKEFYKIYWDFSHVTDKGAEFFARRIEKDKLFLEYLNSTLKISSN